MKHRGVDALREALNRITAERVPLTDQIGRIEQLAPVMRHSIRGRTVRHTAGFNCFAFAFGLYDDPDYRQIARAEARLNGRRFFASSDFTKHIIRGGHLQPAPRHEINPGDLVFYWASNKIAHAATAVSPTRFRSKWGRGHLYDHRLWEVPQRYGHLARFFRQPKQALPRTVFRQFLAAHPAWPAFAEAADLNLEMIA